MEDIVAMARAAQRDERLSDGALYGKLADEIERSRAGLKAAIRAAKLALFVIRKQGVMPNSSWESGFESDLKTAQEAISVPNGDR